MSWWDPSDMDSPFYDIYLMDQYIWEEQQEFAEDPAAYTYETVAGAVTEVIETGSEIVGEGAATVAGGAARGAAAGLKDQPMAWIVLGVLVLGALVYLGSVVKAFKP
jgi:hypothetical protein